MNITETVPGSYVVVTSAMVRRGARRVRVETVREFAASSETEARAAFLRRYPDAESAEGFRFESIRPETRAREATLTEIAEMGRRSLAAARRV